MASRERVFALAKVGPANESLGRPRCRLDMDGTVSARMIDLAEVQRATTPMALISAATLMRSALSPVGDALRRKTRLHRKQGLSGGIRALAYAALHNRVDCWRLRRRSNSIR